MRRDAWERLAGRLDVLAETHPGRYRALVVAFTALGYLVMLGSLLVLLLLAVGVGVLMVRYSAGAAVLGVKVLIPVVGLGLVLGRSLWVRITPPNGIDVRRSDAPELWRAVDDLCVAIGGRVHAIRLTGELNAAAASVPRWGITGPKSGYLVVGLPLTAALPEDEFLAVVAHEVAHLSHKHGRFGAWAYRQRSMWVRVVHSLGERGSIAFAGYAVFLNWYAPRFDAITLAAARRHEYAADAAAAAATSPEAIARSLMRLEVAGDWVGSTYWEAVFDRVRDTDTPPTAPLTGMIETLTAVASDGLAPWHSRETAEDALYSAHPTTLQRINALHIDAAQDMSFDPTASAARRYLGAFAQDAARRIDRDWHHRILPGWKAEHREVQAAAEQLAKLTAETADGEVSVEQDRTRATLAERALGPAGAIPVYREILARRQDPVVCYRLGVALLGQHDDEGLEQLAAAVELDPAATEPACALSADYLRRRGRADEAAEWANRTPVVREGELGPRALGAIFGQDLPDPGPIIGEPRPRC